MRAYRRSETTAITQRVVERFNDAFNRHHVDEIMANMTSDCVFEDTEPPPDGTRHEGQETVRAVWEQLFASTPSAKFETEELFACEDRCVVRWLFHWIDSNGEAGHVRGIDLFRVRDGKIAEKLSYVKG
jgi:ketosteroid isomerase-like protein